MNIVFAGTPQFAAIILDALLRSNQKIKAVYTQPDRPAGRGQHLTASPVKLLALEHCLPVYQPVTLKQDEEQKKLAALEADVMIVVAYGLLLPSEILKIPAHGCINIHASLLPRWRGAAPIQRAIMAGDKKTGITIMQMDAGLDTGPMLASFECRIEPTDTSHSLHDKLAELGSEAILTTLEKLKNNKLMPRFQDESQASYAPKIPKQEADIDWNQRAYAIDCKIRAFNPWPIAQTCSDGHLIRVWQATIRDENKTSTTPGKIINISTQGIDVETASGILQLQTIQLPGGRALPVSDILNSKKEIFKIGLILGKQP